MAVSSANPFSGVRKVVTLTSGTSWTVPAGVTFVNATLIGGGGGGSAGMNDVTTGPWGKDGRGGQVITTTVDTTPGASISYSIGSGGTAGSGTTAGGTGGTTTFTGATSATGGGGGSWKNGSGSAGSAGFVTNNGGAGGGGGTNSTGAGGGAGGAGQIILEYWV